MGDTEQRQVKTAKRVFDIINIIQRLEEPRLVDIAEEIHLSKSTVHHYLTTLMEMEYVQKTENTYQLGLKFLDHGIHAKNQYLIVGPGEEAIRDLADATGEIAWVAVAEQGKIVHVSKAMSDDAVQTLGRVGGRHPMHYLASGKAILSQLPPERVDEIIDSVGMASMTPSTITDRETLLEELEAIRERGYALNDEEATPATRAIGVAITVNNEVLGAITVSGPKFRLNDERIEDEILNVLLSRANELEVKLGYEIT